MQKCCVPRRTVLCYGWLLAIVKVLSAAEIVLEYKAFFFRLLRQLGCCRNLGIYISLVSRWCLCQVEYRPFSVKSYEIMYNGKGLKLCDLPG